MVDVLTDFRSGVRQLRIAPSVAFTVIVTLALCIALHTTVFAIVDAVLIRSFAHLRLTDPGFDGSHVIAATVSLPLRNPPYPVRTTQSKMKAPRQLFPRLEWPERVSCA